MSDALEHNDTLLLCAFCETPFACSRGQLLLYKATGALVEFSRQQRNTCDCNTPSTSPAAATRVPETPRLPARVSQPPPCMEPAISAVAQEPLAAAQQTHRLGRTQCQGGWRGWARSTLILVLFLAVTGSFAGTAYRARRSSRDLAFVLVAYYLIVLLLCCVVKLEQLRRVPGARVAERRRVRIAVWAVSVALGNTFASRVADAMPGLALKLAVWGFTAVVLGLGFYFFFCSKDAECCNAEHGRGQADAGGGLPAMALHELSPEEKV